MNNITNLNLNLNHFYNFLILYDRFLNKKVNNTTHPLYLNIKIKILFFKKYLNTYIWMIYIDIL